MIILKYLQNLILSQDAFDEVRKGFLNPGYGYFYDPDESILHPDAVAAHLRTQWWGRIIYTADELSSTIDVAKKMISESNADRHGTVILANTQTKGRGRYGNRWVSPKGKDILLTFLIKNRGWEPSISLLTLYTAITVVRVLNTAYDLAAAIKWPNDIIFEGRRLGGVLVERDKSADYQIMSLGLNVHSRPKDWPPDVRHRAASLSMIKDVPWQRDVLIAQCGITWEMQWEIMNQDHGHMIREYWNRYSTTLNKTVSILYKGKAISAFAKSIDHDGGLVLLTDNGAEISLVPEEVQMLKVIE